MDIQNRRNPWLGLESYREGEVLYGRDDDIRDLTQCVLTDTDTLLYGKSGIGKSSILNAGVIPAARRNGFLPVLIRLSHKESHSYLEQIRQALTQVVTLHEVVPCKDAKKESPYEFFHRHTFHNADGERVKLLIIFDQFEEIFTLQNDESKKKRFFSELADLLNDIMPADLQLETVVPSNVQEEVDILDAGNFDDLFNDLNIGTEGNAPEYVEDNDIHMVFTIREDFLSEFEYYSSTIPSLKQNRYGLRPINEEQASQIILRPQPGLISLPVAKLIIERVTGRTDFELDGVPEIEVDSAVLSLYLNRLYDAKEGDTITEELVEQKGGEIIADFYSDAISEISESTVEYLEDMLLNGQGRRDNITIFDAINDGHVSETELDILCNKKKILRQFNYAGDLRIEYVHDILCPVVKAHKDERIMLKQQEEERQRQEEEKRQLMLEEQAKREKIEREAEEERQRMQAEAIRVRRRNRHRLMVAGIIMLLMILTAGGYYFYYVKEYKASYAVFTTRNGWPQGIGDPLGESDKRQMSVYYQLVRRGYRGKVTRVNVLNSHKDPTRNKFDESPLVGLYETESTDEHAKKFAMLQRQTSYWKYNADNDGNILRRTAYDPDGNELYAIQYFRSSAATAEGDDELSQKKQLWANYVDKDGKSMRIRDNGADRVRIITDSLGYVKGYQFYSETGTPQPNHMGAYGLRFSINEHGSTVSITPVDAFGDAIAGQTITFTEFDNYHRWKTASRGKALYSRELVVFTMDNRTDSLKFGDQGQLYYHSETTIDGARRIFEYDKGQVKRTFHYASNAQKNKLLYSREVLPQKTNGIKETVVYWADSTMHYRLRREEQRLHGTTVAYYWGNSPTTTNNPMTVTMTVGRWHKMTCDTTQTDGLKKVRKEYIDADGKLAKNCRYNCEESYYNKSMEKVKTLVYKNGECIYGYINEYEDGQIVVQSVVGIDGKTCVRYPKWDVYHLCYYKLKPVYNFSNTLVAVKAINEFGEESLITTSDKEDYRVSILPSAEMSTSKDDADIYGLQVYKIQTPAVNEKRQVQYIHIQDMKGTWYQAGVRDGDLLVSNGPMLSIARPNPAKDTYDIREVKIPAGAIGAEHYTVYFTEKEMNRYNHAISQKK